MAIIIMIVLALVVLAGFVALLKSAASQEARMTAAERRAKLKAQADQNRSFAANALDKSNEHQVMFVNRQKCLAGISPDGLRIDCFPLFETKQVGSEDRIVIELPTIVSIEWEESTRLARQTEVQREPVIVHHRKSPVMRGLVGTVALGPIGTVLGAASGMNSKVEMKHVDRKVTKMVEVAGPRSILLGTNLPDRPVIRLRAPHHSKTEEWFYRIRATLLG